ncbi:hypothetical protein MAHJHV47_45140 [Mycobacterium avium subsp. hominissuis]
MGHFSPTATPAGCSNGATVSTTATPVAPLLQPAGVAVGLKWPNDVLAGPAG